MKRNSASIFKPVVFTLLALTLTNCSRSSRGLTLTIMAPAAPGGGWDQTSRAMQQVLKDSGLVRSAQVLNVPGAGGIIGLAQLVNANRGNGDMLMTMGLIMMGAVLTNRSPVKLDQVTPIARLTGESEVLVVPESSPFRTLADFVAAWKEDPGGMAIAGGSAGGTDHIVVGLLAREVQVPTERINYLPHSGGGESIAALLGGHVAAGVNGYAELAPFIRSGQLRVLAVSGSERLPDQDFPTFLEQGVQLALTNWRGVAAAPGISAEQRTHLTDLIDRMHLSDQWQSILKKNDWIDMYLSGTEFETFLAEENGRVNEVLRSIGLVQ